MFKHLKTSVALAAIVALVPSLAKTPKGFSDNAEIVSISTGHPGCRENPGVASNCWEQACDSVTGNSARIKLMAPAEKTGQFWVECTLDIKIKPVPIGSDLDNYTGSAISKTGFHLET
ncbi:hypothetical protein CBOM_03070 [Ceraceosorus bombacis]|uniref:Uncharacterized protein n=1 Tax=Ceraceosorus bombacis TaxID=401625 RepID=A0A0P1BLG3_9BASI|nr:hypothetical protein CBOM_03070 [Ceraceosorus bombacis]